MDVELAGAWFATGHDMLVAVVTDQPERHRGAPFGYAIASPFRLDAIRQLLWRVEMRTAALIEHRL